MTRPAPRYPSLLEINTRVWLRRLSREAGRPVTLADVDDAMLDDIARRGFDWVWLLSVWRTGAAGRAVSRDNPAWQAEFRSALPDLTEEDICGSGFAIAAYEVADALGGNAALAAFRARLSARGMRLMLDFVPNQTALDHPWVGSIPISTSKAASRRLPRRPQTIAGSTPSRGRASWPMVAIPTSPAGPIRCSWTMPMRRCRQRRGTATGANRRTMRRPALRHGDARPAGRLPAHLGPDAGALLAEGDRGRTRGASRLHVPGRSLLGPRRGAAAAGLRLLLRQAAVRPPSPGRGSTPSART